LTGAYEILGPGHHFVIWAYRSKSVVQVPTDFAGHHVSDVAQVRWDALEPHPTDMPILNDASAAAYARELIEDLMRREGIVMTNLLNGEVFGAVGSPITGRQVAGG
jgi:8-oxo-dGTP diphosphatase